MRASHARAFTLLEVLVALAIASLALVAAIASISQMIDASTAMRDRTYASWIGQNKIAELRLQNVVPEVSETTGDVQYAGRDWRWEVNISETGVENLFRVDVDVMLPGSDNIIRSTTGFIGEPSIPGEANRAWSLDSAPAGPTI